MIRTGGAVEPKEAGRRERSTLARGGESGREVSRVALGIEWLKFISRQETPRARAELGMRPHDDRSDATVRSTVYTNTLLSPPLSLASSPIFRLFVQAPPIHVVL